MPDCAHCQEPIKGTPATYWTEQTGTLYLHHEDKGPDCYRLVAVCGCTMPCSWKEDDE